MRVVKEVVKALLKEMEVWNVVKALFPPSTTAKGSAFRIRDWAPFGRRHSLDTTGDEPECLPGKY